MNIKLTTACDLNKINPSTPLGVDAERATCGERSRTKRVESSEFAADEATFKRAVGPYEAGKVTEVEALARNLKDEFPQTHGFSKINLWNMRRFYEEYKNKPFLQQLAAEIPV